MCQGHSRPLKDDLPESQPLRAFKGTDSAWATALPPPGVTHLCCQNQFLSCCHLPLTHRLTSPSTVLLPTSRTPLWAPFSPRRICEIPGTSTDHTIICRSSWGPRCIPQAPSLSCPQSHQERPTPQQPPWGSSCPILYQNCLEGTLWPRPFLLRLTTPTQVRPWPWAPAAPEHRHT